MTSLAIALRIASNSARCRPLLHHPYLCHLRSDGIIHTLHDASRTVTSSASRPRPPGTKHNPRTVPGATAGHDTRPKPKPSALTKKKKHFNLNPAVHGKHAIRFGDENDIFIGTKMKPLKTTDFPDSHNPANLNVAMADTHNYAENHYQYLEQREHPFFRTLTDLYREKKRRDSLWFSIRTAPKTCCIAVARLADKKIRQCLRQALWEYGYDLSGRRRMTGEPTAVDGMGNPRMSNHVELYGTIKIGAWDGVRVMQTDPKRLVESLKGIVPVMEAQLGVNEDGLFAYPGMVNFNYVRLDRTQGLEEIEKARDEFLALPEAPHLDRFGRMTGEASKSMADALKNSQLETARLLGEADLSRWAKEQGKKKGLKEKEKRGFVSLLDAAQDLTKVAEEEVNVKRPRGSASARIKENRPVLDVKPLPVTEASFALPDWWVAKRAASALEAERQSAAALDMGADILQAVQVQVDKSAKALSGVPQKPQSIIGGDPLNVAFGVTEEMSETAQEPQSLIGIDRLQMLFGVSKREPRDMKSKKAVPNEIPTAPVPTQPPMVIGTSSAEVESWGTPAVLPKWEQAGPVRFVPQLQAESKIAEEFQEEIVRVEAFPHIYDASHEFDEMEYPPGEEEQARKKRFSLHDMALPAAPGVSRRPQQQQWKRWSLDDSGRATPTDKIFPHGDDGAQDTSNYQDEARSSSSRHDDAYRSRLRRPKKLRSRGNSVPGPRRG